MERDLKLKEFAGELFSYIYRDYNATFDLPVKLPHVFNHHAAGDFTDDEGKAVLKLCVSLRSVFGGVITKAFPHINISIKHFMTFLTSQCLKLCGDDLFLSFIMICAFIAELNLFCWVNGCFAYMNTAPKCLIAIFNRRLRKEFYASGGWDGLKLFCETFVQTEVKNGDASNLPLDYANGEFINQDLLNSVEELLDQGSSSDSDEDSDEDEEEEAEEAVDESEVNRETLNETENNETVEDSEEESEGDEDSEEEEEMDSDSSDDESSEEEEVEQPGTSKIEDEDSESSDDSDPSSMSGDQESESGSESDATSAVSQPNVIVESNLL